MTNQNKLLTIAAAILIINTGFYFMYRTSQTPEPHKVSLCFIRNTEDGGHADIKMNIVGDKVTGEFNWLPNGKDAKTGTFAGSISPVDQMMMGRTLDVIWDAHAEGTVHKEQLKIIMGEGNAAPGFGEMKDRGDGVLVYANPEKIVYEPNLSDVDCLTGK